MSVTASTTLAIRDFALAVRAALGDLPADDVDDLTDGLEADLTEQAADFGDVLKSGALGATADAGIESDFNPGDPVAYADELRAAAGLPVRGNAPTIRLSRLRRLRTRVGIVRADATRRIRSSATASQLLDFLLVLRPLWWVLRGWAVYAVAEIFLGGAISTVPTDPVRWLVLTAFVTLSVQWGRGLWLPWRWLPRFRTVVSVCSVIALPLLLITTAHQARAGDNAYGAYDPYIAPGLVQNGQEVTNVFAYDADGRPLSDVQLFDQDGRPLNVVGDPANTNWLPQYDAAGNQDMLVPSRAVPGGSGWNVFPLRAVSSADIDYSMDVLGQADQADAVPAPSPFAQVQPLVLVPRAGEPTPSPVPTAGSSAGSSAEPTASASPAPQTTPAATEEPETGQ